MSAIDTFLLENDLRIASNPCVSADFCLDWRSLSARLAAAEGLTRYPRSRVQMAAGTVELVSDARGDHASILESQQADARALLESGVALGDGRTAFPATFANLLRLKNLVQEHNPAAPIFPTAAAASATARSASGARFTTLHWPAVDWAMSALGLGVPPTRTRIPRELVYDVDAMLAGKLDTRAVPLHRHQRPRRPPGPERRGHEPRLRAGEAQDRLSPPRHRVELQRRPPADRRQVRRARRRARARAACSPATSPSIFRPSWRIRQAGDDAARWVKADVPADRRRR